MKYYQVDYVLLGAEGVVESGGIVNKIGSYTVSLCAKLLNKPVYVLCESFKFVRLYPLGQTDLPKEYKVRGLKILRSLIWWVLRVRTRSGSMHTHGSRYQALYVSVFLVSIK